MKKVLLLTLEFPPDRGGVARYYGGLVGAMPSGSVVVIRARLSGWIWPRWLPLLWRVWRTIQREKITEIWVGHLLPLGTVVYLLKKLSVVSCQLSRHYSLSNEAGSRQWRWSVFIHGFDLLLAETHPRKKMLVRRILDSADRIVTNSEYGKSLVVARGVSIEKVTVVYPCPTFMKHESGIMNLNSSSPPRKFYHLEGKKILLTVARLVKRKGINLVLEALEKIKMFETKFRTFGDLVYVIVGDGPEREALEAESHKVIKSKVIFVGAVSDSELAAWYETCDVFIMTPRKIGPDVEGFGFVYLEANAFGKPVIGSRTGGVSEAVVDGETGLLVDEGDVHGIAAAITRLMSDAELRKKLGEQGRARVEKEFQWKKQVRKLTP